MKVTFNNDIAQIDVKGIQSRTPQEAGASQMDLIIPAIWNAAGIGDPGADTSLVVKVNYVAATGEMTFDLVSGGGGGLSDGDYGDVVVSGGGSVMSLDSGIGIKQTITVTENISQGNVVNSDGSKADSSVVGKRNKAIGIANAAISSGFSGVVITEGAITYGSWGWTAGDIIFLNGTSLSTTAPSSGFIQIIGKAISATTIEVKISQATRI
jgi:hypothetical protein